MQDYKMLVRRFVADILYRLQTYRYEVKTRWYHVIAFGKQ